MGIAYTETLHEFDQYLDQEIENHIDGMAAVDDLKNASYWFQELVNGLYITGNPHTVEICMEELSGIFQVHLPSPTQQSYITSHLGR